MVSGVPGQTPPRKRSTLSSPKSDNSSPLAETGLIPNSAPSKGKPHTHPYATIPVGNGLSFSPGLQVISSDLALNNMSWDLIGKRQMASFRASGENEHRPSPGKVKGAALETT